MKPEKLFLVLFICMGVLLAMLYGRFELGGWEMERCQKIQKRSSTAETTFSKKRLLKT